MYLPTFNATDIIRLKESEKKDCRAKLTHIYKKFKSQARKALQAGRAFTFATYWKHPKSQSEYILCFAIEDKKSLNNPPFFYFPIVRDKGMNLVFTLQKKGSVMIFTSHFFDRYEERKEVDEADRIELITHFVTRNWGIGQEIRKKTRKGKEEYELRLAEGAAMCNRDSDNAILYAKTFVKDDMYYKEQRERLGNVNLHDVRSLEAQHMILKVLHERGF